jgi:hypothetical protein
LFHQLELLSQGLFSLEPGKVEGQTAAYADARRFFELATSYYFLVHNFPKAEESFAVLTFFYENCRQQLPPSDLEAKVVSLRLVHLYAQGDYAEFYATYASIPARVKQNADFKHLDEFVYFTEIGSFRNAVAAIEKISLVHRGLLSEMEDTLREEWAKQNLQDDRPLLPGLRLRGRAQGLRSEAERRGAGGATGGFHWKVV